jgi:hypothetical protein
MMLGELLKAMHETKITAAFNDVENQRTRIRELENVYTDAIRTLKTYIVIYEGMKATESFDKPEEDLIEYLSELKEIHNLSIHGNKLSFTVATLLNGYGADAYESFAKAGHIYDGEYTHGGRHNICLLDVFKDRNNRKRLLNNIFSESPEYAIKMAGNYTLDLESCRVSCKGNLNYEAFDPIFKTYMPNPHIKIFECLGGYKDKVMKALQNRNYIMAIELCVASAGSVDLDETEQTFRPFIGWLMSTREKVLRRKDGVEMTPEEALVDIIDKEKANETT